MLCAVMAKKLDMLKRVGRVVIGLLFCLYGGFCCCFCLFSFVLFVGDLGVFWGFCLFVFSFGGFFFWFLLWGFFLFFFIITWRIKSSVSFLCILMILWNLDKESLHLKNWLLFVFFARSFMMKTGLCVGVWVCVWFYACNIAFVSQFCRPFDHMTDRLTKYCCSARTCRSMLKRRVQQCKKMCVRVHVS